MENIVYKLILTRIKMCNLAIVNDLINNNCLILNYK